MQTLLTYLGRESRIKYLGGAQIETFTHVHTHTHIYTHTHTHTKTHTHLRICPRAFSYAIYLTDMKQTYITDITVNAKDIIRPLL